MSGLQHYLDLEAKLHEWRKEHPEDTPEEDLILDEMEAAWWALTDAEMAWINRRDAGQGEGEP